MAEPAFICLDCTASFEAERDAQLHEAARTHRVWPEPPPMADEDRAIARALSQVAPRKDHPPERAGAVHLRSVSPPHRRHRGVVVQDRHERWMNRMLIRGLVNDLAAAGIGRSGVHARSVGRYWH